MRKRNMKKDVMKKVISKVKKMIEEMIRRGKCRTIENNKWQRQECIKESNSGTTKDAIKIKLHLC